MDLIFDSVKIIYDSTKKKLLEIPNDTHLDEIYRELWPNILKYMGCYPYLISNTPMLCDGYRIMKKEEFDQDLFFQYYFLNDGIQSNIKSAIGNLVVDKYLIKMNKKIIYCSNNRGKIEFDIDRKLGTFNFVEKLLTVFL